MTKDTKEQFKDALMVALARSTEFCRDPNDCREIACPWCIKATDIDPRASTEHWRCGFTLINRRLINLPTTD